MPPSLQPQSTTKFDPLSAYEQCVKEGKLKNDDAQRLVIDHLQTLYDALAAAGTRSVFSKILPRRAALPRSIYIWGAVGRGKSLLMDMFHAAAPVTAKRRVHFHAFMQEVHGIIHTTRQEIEAGRLHKELIPAVAEDIAKRSGQLICLDELQVTDVADAMILSKLFTSLLAEGVTFVVTSNHPPEDLYLQGLQRQTFMEFVDLVYARMDVLELASPNDYRMQKIRAMQAVYMWPESSEAKAALQNIFAQLTHHTELMPVTLELQERKLQVKESYGGIARFTFYDLCETPLGAADYLAVAHRFHTVFLTNIPKMNPEKRNEARRFVTLIDTLYDHRVKLICTAAAAPAALYPEGDGTFEFARTVSRLAEMQSAQYLSSPHIP